MKSELGLGSGTRQFPESVWHCRDRGSSRGLRGQTGSEATTNLFAGVFPVVRGGSATSARHIQGPCTRPRHETTTVELVSARFKT